MDIKKLFASFCLVVFTPSVWASIIELSCSNTASEMSNYVVIDTVNKSVMDDKMEGTNVSINKNTISYYLIYKREISEFSVKINRTTGKMVVINLSTKSIDSHYNCEPIKPKF